MKWQAACEQLWGEDWQRGLAETVCVNPRTAQRWAAGETILPDGVRLWLDVTISTIPRSMRRAYGKMMRAAASAGDPGDAVTVAQLVARDVSTRPPWGNHG